MRIDCYANLDHEILKDAEGEWKDICFIALRLFSVPRRSNTVVMEELIKIFAPNLRRESSLAYFSLPREGKTLHGLSPKELEKVLSNIADEVHSLVKRLQKADNHH